MKPAKHSNFSPKAICDIEQSRASLGFFSNLRQMLKVILTGGPLLITDLVCFASSLYLALIGVKCLMEPAANVELNVVAIWLSLGLVLTFYYFGLYPAVMMKPVEEFHRLGNAITLTLALYATIYASFSLSEGYIVEVLVLAWLVSLVLLPVGRYLCRSIFCHFSWWTHPALVIVQAKDAPTLSFDLSCKRLGLGPFTLINGEAAHKILSGDFGHVYLNHWLLIVGDQVCNRMQGIGRISDFTSKFHNTVLMYPAMGWSDKEDTSCPLGRIDVHYVRLANSIYSHVQRGIKRLLDILSSIIFIILILPLFAVIVGAMKLSSPGPILYRHRRIGLQGRHFDVYKFRTMEVDADSKLEEYLCGNPDLKKEWELNQKLERDPRITRVGSFLRKSSLDELPQLWNVLKGEMSLVGPRPIIDEEIARYGESFDLYKMVRPGVTGLWQVSGRNKVPYSRRVQLDAFYVRNWSLSLDLYIFLTTFKTVVLREGAS